MDLTLRSADFTVDMLSTAIASVVSAYGLIEDNENVVIGSMLISPIGGQLFELLNMATGVPTEGNPAVELGMMIAICLVIGYVIANKFPTGERNNSKSLNSRHQWVSAFKETYSAAMIGVMCGFILTIARKHNNGAFNSVSAGVGIATSLLPPIVASGILWNDKKKTEATNAFGLFVVNAVSIMIGVYIGNLTGFS